MNFGDVLKTIGSGLLSTHPVGAGIVSAVNLFLDDDDKLPEGATGEQVKRKVGELPAEAQTKLMEKQVDLDIKKEEGWTERYKSMCENDGQSTRPRIALMMAKVFCGVLLGFVIILAYAVATEGVGVLNAPYLWTVFASLTATPAGLLAKYFGELRREQRNRMETMSGKNPTNDLGIIETLISKIKR